MSPDSEMQARENVNFAEFSQYLASITPESWARISEGYSHASGSSQQVSPQLQQCVQNIQQSKSEQGLTRLFSTLTSQTTSRTAGAS